MCVRLAQIAQLCSVLEKTEPALTDSGIETLLPAKVFFILFFSELMVVPSLICGDALSGRHVLFTSCHLINDYSY